MTTMPKRPERLIRALAAEGHDITEDGTCSMVCRPCLRAVSTGRESTVERDAREWARRNNPNRRYVSAWRAGRL